MAFYTLVSFLLHIVSRLLLEGPMKNGFCRRETLLNDSNIKLHLLYLLFIACMGRVISNTCCIVLFWKMWFDTKEHGSFRYHSFSLLLLLNFGCLSSIHVLVLGPSLVNCIGNIMNCSPWQHLIQTAGYVYFGKSRNKVHF